MHKNIKKIITGIAVIAIMATMITPIGVSARTYNAGTLFWDFESTDDIAYHAGNDTYSNVVDVVEAGAWDREWPAKDKDTSWKFNVIQMTHADMQTERGTTESLTDGGTYCLRLFGNATGDWTYYSSGTGIMLSDKELIPGMEYEVEVDIFDQYDYNTPVVAAYSKPSARNTDYSDKKSRVPWLKEGQGGYTTASMATGKNGANNIWDKATARITVPENMYENGYVMLYISLYSSGGGLPGHYTYFDNIKITPVGFKTSKTSYAKLRYGKSWDFEDYAGINSSTGEYETDLGIPGNANGGSSAENYNDTFARGHWSSINPGGTNPSYAGPKIRKVEEALMYPNGNTTNSTDGLTLGYDGTAALGSNYCARVRVHVNNNSWNTYTLGSRVRLTKEEFPVGSYVLDFHAGFTKEVTAGYKINAKVYPGEKVIKDIAASGTGVSESLNENYAISQELGKLGTYWRRYTTTLNLTDDCFDENGVATLVLHTNYTQQSPTAILYLDDISLYSEERTIAAGDKVNFFVTTVSDAPISNILSLAATKEGYALKDCDVSETSVSAIDTKNYTVQIPSGVTNPEFKLYMWNKTTLEPLALPMD